MCEGERLSRLLPKIPVETLGHFILFTLAKNIVKLSENMYKQFQFCALLSFGKLDKDLHA